MNQSEQKNFLRVIQTDITFNQKCKKLGINYNYLSTLLDENVHALAAEATKRHFEKLTTQN